MTSPWCPRLRHLVDNVELKEQASSGAPADTAEPRRERAAQARPKTDVAANGPAPALGKSELAYDIGPSQQPDEEEDTWQEAGAAPKEEPSAAAASKAPKAGAPAAANGGPAKKKATSLGKDAAGTKKKQQQAWPDAVGGSYDWQANWEATDGWSSNGGWQGDAWTGSDSGTSWQQSGPVGAGEEAPVWKDSSRQPLKQQGKAAPYAKVEEAAESGAVGAAEAEAAPGEMRGKRGKKVARKEAIGLRWVEKDAAAAAPAPATRKDCAAEAAQRDAQQGARAADRRGKPRPILQWRVAGRGAGGANDETTTATAASLGQARGARSSR